MVRGTMKKEKHSAMRYFRWTAILLCLIAVSYTHLLVQINTNQRYLLLPVEEVMPDVRVSMIVNNKEVKAADVRCV